MHNPKPAELRTRCKMKTMKREEDNENQAEDSGKRKRQKFSKVWDHFELKRAEDIVHCVHCKAELAYHKSTSSMIQHLIRKHPVYASNPGTPELSEYSGNKWSNRSGRLRFRESATGEETRNVSSTEQRSSIPCSSPGIEPVLESQWRYVEWTELQKTSLLKTVSSYKPCCDEVTQARVLLLGPVGSGKSSFISSVQSVFNGRVTNRAMVGSSSTSFTKKLQSFNIRGQKGEYPSALVLCDIMGLGDGEMTGLTPHDILSIIKGHVPEGHRFSPVQPVILETTECAKRPSLKDKIHCVAFVVDASKLPTYPKSLTTIVQQLRDHISDLGVHQVALLTHVDLICPETAKDVSQVYTSRIIQDTMVKAGALLGMSTSYIIPVKNYTSELDVDVNTDVLLLTAVDHILQYADLYYQDNM